MQNVEMQGLKGCLTKKAQTIWVVFEATYGIQDQTRRATGKKLQASLSASWETCQQEKLAYRIRDTSTHRKTALNWFNQ